MTNQTTQQTQNNKAERVAVFIPELTVKGVILEEGTKENGHEGQTKITYFGYPKGKKTRFKKWFDNNKFELFNVEKHVKLLKEKTERRKKRIEDRKKQNKQNNKKSERKPLQVKVKYHDPEMPKLEKISVGDWIDLRSVEDVELKAGEYKLISLGIGMKLPKGYEVVIAPRSSTFKTWGVLQSNSLGVVDNSYSGNEDIYRFPAYATRDTKINKYDRICQFRIQRVMPKVEFVEVESLDEVSRGGFGSTGKN